MSDVLGEGPSFSFGGDVTSAALAMMEGGDTQSTESVEQVSTPEQTVAEPTVEPQEVTNVDNASAAKLAQLADDDIVEVTVDGELVQLPWAEAKGGIMRQRHYTKEMQALRREQQEFEANRQALLQAQQEREALVQFLNSEDMVRQFLQRKYPNLLTQAQQQAVQQVAQQQQVDPDDIATVGQVEQVAKAYAENVAKLVEQLKSELQQEVSKVTQTIEDRQAAAKLGAEINNTIAELFKAHPHVVKVIPNAEQVLRYEVLQMQPSTPEQTIEAFKTVFGGWVENYNAAVKESTKQSVLAKQKMVQNNVQAPGGAPVQPTPSTFKTKDGKIDWDALRANALNILNQHKGA